MSYFEEAPLPCMARECLPFTKVVIGGWRQRVGLRGGLETRINLRGQQVERCS